MVRAPETAVDGRHSGAGGPDPSGGDVAIFLDCLRSETGFFRRDAPVFVARAPGRLDLMGGIADYSGSLVLQLPLADATFVAAQVSPEPAISVRTLTPPDAEAEREVITALADLAPSGRPLEYAAARALFAAVPRRHWAAYVTGTLLVLARERGIPLAGGMRLLVRSDVPVGKGVSSSAALEVAAMHAACAALGVELPGRELALLCQKVENLVVGAPCGVMDQMTAACGEAGRLLALLCQPAELQPSVAIPPGLEVFGIDSGVRHAVTGADYGDVRVAAFMGYRIVAELAGLRVHAEAGGRVRVEDPRWGGYLANVGPAEWEAAFRDRVPERLDGAAFLERYGGTTDPVTRVDPHRSYALRQATAHPIQEHERVRRYRELLERPDPGEETWVALGELMYASHESYGACGLGSGATDRIVELVREAGAAHGLYGAKITGGGSGGTVAVLARRGASEAVAQIARRYGTQTGHETMILGGSSPGATVLGAARIT